MARIAVKAKVAVNPHHVPVEQVVVDVLAVRRVPVEQASQEVRLSQQVQVVVQCHRVRSIVRVDAVDKYLGCHSRVGGNPVIKKSCEADQNAFSIKALDSRLRGNDEIQSLIGF
jgi:hypothetical protein